MDAKRDKPLVLVADDTHATTIMLQRLFEYEGYRVHCAYNGPDALDAAREMHPDLVLLDINMPGMNGFEVLQRMRESELTASIPTILITAVGDQSAIVQGLQLGADDYVRKPFHYRELLARAESKIRARRLEDALQRRTKELEMLLKVSHELNQHLQIDEILELVGGFIPDLLHGAGAIILQLNNQHEITGTRIKSSNADVVKALQSHDHRDVINWLLERGEAFAWSERDTSPLKGFSNGLVAPIQRDEQNGVQSMVVVVSDTEYNSSNLELLNGIVRQAAMALKNAELYRIKANYAEHLEEMVEARTHELRSAQHMLIRSEKLASIGRLAASIAHEINNPLLPIQINLDDMLEDLQEDRSIDAEEITRTQESVERIRRIVNRLLEFAGSSYTSDVVRPLDLNKLIRNVSELVAKSLEQKGQRIELDLASIPQMQGDKDGLEQVFMNLILNGSEAMQDGGLIRISSQSEQDRIVIRVADNGSGFPSEVLEKIFEPFVSTKEDGNGLGLFISYGIIQNHQGTIELTSDSSVPGSTGTTFIITLPLAHDLGSIASQHHNPDSTDTAETTTAEVAGSKSRKTRREKRQV